MNLMNPKMFITWTCILVLMFPHILGKEEVAEVVSRRQEESIPVIVDDPDSQVVPRDSPTTLNCRAEGYPEPEITWHKDGQPLVIQARDALMTTMQNGDLFFLRVNNRGSQSDDGVYQCVATNRLGTAVSKNATLTVAYMREDFRANPQDMQIVVGDPVVFACVPPKSNPQPIITWEKNDNQLQPDGERVRVLDDGNLMISPAMMDDSGRYRCVATIRALEESRKSDVAVLAVHELPEFRTFPEDQKVLPGDSVVFDCSAEGEPPPAISWHRESANLPDRRYSLVGNSLHIRNAEEADSGLYTCTASNTWGNVRSQAELIVDPSPRFISRPSDQTIREGQDVEFRCQVIGKPPPAVLWNKQGRDDQVQLTDTMVINEATLADEGIYTCSAFSDLGTIESSVTLRVVSNELRLPPVIQYGPSNQTLTVGDTARFTCQVGANLGGRLSIRWRKGEDAVQFTNIRFYQSENGYLEVTDLQSQDSGLYTCIASNGAGETRWTASLRVITLSETVLHPVVSSPVTQDLPAPPQMPVGFNITSTSVCLSWGPPRHSNQEPTILGYRVEGIRTDQSEESWQKLADNIMEETTTIFNLLPDSEVIFAVRARNKYGFGAASPLTHVVSIPASQNGGAITDQIPTAVAPLPATTISVANAISSSTIKVMWQEISSEIPISGFKLHYEESANPGNGETETLTADTYMFMINRLERNTEYTISVAAYRGGHTGQKASVRVHTQDERGDDSWVPENSVLQGKLNNCGISLRKIEVLSSTELQVSWQIDRYVMYIEGYHVKIKPQHGDDFTIEAVTNTKTKVISDLTPWTTYVITVQPFSGQYTGPETERRLARTAEGAPTVAPELEPVRSLNSTAIQIVWIPPPRDTVPGIILGYQIFCHSNHPRRQSNLTVPGNVTVSAIIGELSPGVTYGVHVAAFTSAGMGPFSSAQSITTDTMQLAPTNRVNANPNEVDPTTDDSLSGVMRLVWLFPILGLLFLVCIIVVVVMVTWKKRRRKHTHSVNGADKGLSCKENGHKLGQLTMNRPHPSCCSADGSCSSSSNTLEKPLAQTKPNWPNNVPSHWIQEAYDPPQFNVGYKPPEKSYLHQDSQSSSGVGSSFPTLSTFHGTHRGLNSPEYAVVEHPDEVSMHSPMLPAFYGPPHQHSHPRPSNFLPAMPHGMQYPAAHHAPGDTEPYASATLVMPADRRKPQCSDNSSEWSNSWKSAAPGMQERKGSRHSNSRKGSKDEGIGGAPPVPRRDPSASGYSDQSSLYSAGSQGSRRKHKLHKKSPGNWSEFLPPPPEQSPSPPDQNLPMMLPGQMLNRPQPPLPNMMNHPQGNMNIHQGQDMQMRSIQQMPGLLQMHNENQMNIHNEHHMNMHRPHPPGMIENAFQPVTNCNQISHDPFGMVMQGQNLGQYCEQCPECNNQNMQSRYIEDERHRQSPLNIQHDGMHDNDTMSSNGSSSNRTYPSHANNSNRIIDVQHMSPRQRTKFSQQNGHHTKFANSQSGQNGSTPEQYSESSGSSIASQRVFVDPRHAQIGQELLKYMSAGELQALAGDKDRSKVKPSQIGRKEPPLPPQRLRMVSDSELNERGDETDYELLSTGHLSASCASVTSCNTSHCSSGSCSESEGSFITETDLNSMLTDAEGLKTGYSEVEHSTLRSSHHSMPDNGRPIDPKFVCPYEGTNVKPATLSHSPDMRLKVIANINDKSKEDTV